MIFAFATADVFPLNNIPLFHITGQVIKKELFQGIEKIYLQKLCNMIGNEPQCR
jgi:hypothetical protein